MGAGTSLRNARRGAFYWRGSNSSSRSIALFVQRHSVGVRRLCLAPEPDQMSIANHAYHKCDFARIPLAGNWEKHVLGLNRAQKDATHI
jgi:hypothetical protein